jgi:hypothetical protein
MGHMRTQIFPANPNEPFSGHFDDADLPVLLESCVREILHGEAELARATANFDRILASCRRHGQSAQADAPLKDLAERRAR